MSPRNLSWRVTGGSHVELDGVVDEFAELDKLPAEITGSRVTFDLGKLRRMNSVGVRSWIQMLAALKGKTLTLLHCPPVIVEQLNAIQNFRGEAEVRSVLLPYSCEKCAEPFMVEIELNAKTPPLVAATAPCPKCGTASEFDDVPERYLNFVRYL